MLKVLGRPTSINVRKVLWLCAEIGLPYEHEPWGTDELPLGSEAFLALNPNARVPVLIDDGFVLYESHAICRYLAARNDRDDLLPVDLRARAVVDQWMDWMATELNDAWRYAFMGLVRHSPAHADPAMQRASKAAWNGAMTLLDRQLERTGAHVCGHSFTLADVSIGLAVQRWFLTPIERPDLPAVRTYYDLLAERAGYRAHGRNGTP